MNSNKKGFTLIELIVVIGILAVLAMILVPMVTGYMNRTKQAVANSNARACYSAAMIVQTMIDTGMIKISSSPPTIADINAPYEEMALLGFIDSASGRNFYANPEEGQCLIIDAFGMQGSTGSVKGTRFKTNGVVGTYKP